MNRKIADFHRQIKDSMVAVMGVGISNRPLIRYLHKLGAKITAFDALPENDPVLAKTKQDFEAEGIFIAWSVGKDYLQQLTEVGFDYIFRTPRMRHDLPEIQGALEKGAVLTSEMEVFLTLCPCKTFAVTGSDGKTTTTTLIALILKQAGYTVHVGGNIGTPLLDRVETMAENDLVVLELSSFQLLTMNQSPDVAVITNISPNHLDMHRDYQEYIDAKKHIFQSQNFMGRLVLNADNQITAGFFPEARVKKAYFSWEEQSNWAGKGNSFDHAFVKDGFLCYQQGNQEIEKILSIKEVLIPGRHNVENYLAAASATMPWVKAEDIRQVAMSFPGVEHRIELVRTLDNVRYYNSSIDTSPNRTINSMLALADRGEKGVLIAGGADKQCDYTGVGQAILQVCDRIVLCGSNSPQIRAILEQEAHGRDYQIIETEDYAQALAEAKKLAHPGELVILSPVGTSYDRFRHFEERGNLFKKLVMELA